MGYTKIDVTQAQSPQQKFCASSLIKIWARIVQSVLLLSFAKIIWPYNCALVKHSADVMKEKWRLTTLLGVDNSIRKLVCF